MLYIALTVILTVIWALTLIISKTSNNLCILINNPALQIVISNYVCTYLHVSVNIIINPFSSFSRKFRTISTKYPSFTFCGQST